MTDEAAAPPGVAADAELEARTSALSALLQTEDAGIQNSSQVSMALIGIITAYLPVSVFAVYQVDFPPLLVGYLAWPVMFLMFYQMIMVAGTSRRARSAALVESKLIEIGQLRPEWNAGLIGARARNPILNLYTIVKERGDRWISRYIAALLPFVGLYALGVIYTFFMCAEASRLNPAYPERFWAVIVPILGAVLLWTVFADSAMSYFTRRYKINIWVPTAAVVGIWLQTEQTDLNTPTILLFSVLSAALIAFGAVTRPMRLPWHDVIARAGIAGVLLSSVAYWLLIVPTQGLRSEEPILWANLSMHLILPVVTIAAIVSRRSPLQPLPVRRALAMLLFPLAYAIVLWALTSTLDIQNPYFFVDPQRATVPILILSCVAAALLFTLAGLWEWLILALRRKRGL